MSSITPCLLFSGQAEEAARFYTDLFGGTIDDISRYPDSGQAIMVVFTLFDRRYLALNGPDIAFNEGVSFSVSCRDQAELDRYFDALTAQGGQDGPCGWLKDRYGLSWQLVPEEVERLHRSGDTDGIKRMMGVMMTMRKLDLAQMKAAFEGETA